MPQDQGDNSGSRKSSRSVSTEGFDPGRGELREMIARQIFAICDNVFAQEVFAENAVGQILDIPEIREALLSVAILEGERKIFANYRADMGRSIKR